MTLKRVGFLPRTSARRPRRAQPRRRTRRPDRLRRTDGEWVWPRDLAYYVRAYRVALPREFIANVRERHGRPPPLSRDELVRLAEEYIP